jgi:hypothetical protein
LEVEGYLSVNAASGWGGRASTTPITGEVVWSDDGDPGNERKGCKDAQKKSILGGKIVLIERGLCDFSAKAYFAQKAGAKAVIICGFDEQNAIMGAGENAALVTIPAYYARKSVCDKIAPFVGKGLVITVKTPEDTNADRIVWMVILTTESSHMNMVMAYPTDSPAGLHKPIASATRNKWEKAGVILCP